MFLPLRPAPSMRGCAEQVSSGGKTNPPGLSSPTSSHRCPCYCLPPLCFLMYHCFLGPFTTCRHILAPTVPVKAFCVCTLCCFASSVTLSLLPCLSTPLFPCSPVSHVLCTGHLPPSKQNVTHSQDNKDGCMQTTISNTWLKTTCISAAGRKVYVYDRIRIPVSVC